MTETSPPDRALERPVAGKYLTFALGQESYGIPVIKIREILRYTDLTPVPGMPAHIKGVLNLRGKIIPVIDLRVRFGLPAAAVTERTCIVVVRLEGGGPPMGLIVDAVEEVVQFAASDIEPTPDFGSACDTAGMLGMAKSRSSIKTLLDIDQVLAAEEPGARPPREAS